MTGKTKDKINVLFVCLGNICRSPMSEAIFAQLVSEAALTHRFEIASAGTGAYHIGESPHRGTRAILAKHDVPPTGKRAQQTTPEMLARADYIIAMDTSNVQSLSRFAGSFDDNVSLLLEYAPDASTREVPDPYYHDNFDGVYQLVRDGARGLLDHIRVEENL